MSLHLENKKESHMEHPFFFKKMLQSILPRCTLKTSFQCTKKNCFILLLSTGHVSEELVLMCSSQIRVMNKIDSHYFAKHPAIKEKSG